MQPLVEDHAADELHVVVAHLEDAPAGLAADREGLGQQVVERGAVVEPLRNSAVFARSSASDLACSPPSSELMCSTIGRIPLMTRAFLVPKIFFATKLIMFDAVSRRRG